MKNLFISLTLILASTAAVADGFYQQVIDQLNPSTEEVSKAETVFTYSPLYLQVHGDGKRAIDLKGEISNRITLFTYTPLYNKVVGLGS